MNDDILSEILQRLTKIEVKIDNVEKIKDDIDVVKSKIIELTEKDNAQAKEIQELKDKNIWLTRTIIAALLSGAVGIAFCYIKIGMGI